MIKLLYHHLSAFRTFDKHGLVSHSLAPAPAPDGTPRLSGLNVLRCCSRTRMRPGSSNTLRIVRPGPRISLWMNFVDYTQSS